MEFVVAGTALAVIALGGGYRLYYEAPLADGSHELRTAAVPPAP